MKKTKIVCTMGPQEENIELVKQLIPMERMKSSWPA